jgi:hypothetical protein
VPFVIVAVINCNPLFSGRKEEPASDVISERFQRQSPLSDIAPNTSGHLEKELTYLNLHMSRSFAHYPSTIRLGSRV